MKIFTNNFCVTFKSRKEEKAFQFETSDMDRVLDLLTKKALFFNWQVFYVDISKQPDMVKKVVQFIKKENPGKLRAELVLYLKDQEEVLAAHKIFRQQFKLVKAAGGIVMNEKDEVLLILREGKWDIPKGKLDPGEKFDVAALREVEEETGIKNHHLGDFFSETYHIFFRKEWRVKKTHWYMMHAEGNQHLVPQIKEGITMVKWVPLHTLKKEIPETYPMIMFLLRQLCSPMENVYPDIM